MAIKVFIKRKVSDDKVEGLTPLLKLLRARVSDQPGYISGETLTRLDNPGERLVISTWETENDWNAWLNHSERIHVQNKIDNLLGEKTEFAIYR